MRPLNTKQSERERATRTVVHQRSISHVEMLQRVMRYQDTLSDIINGDEEKIRIAEIIFGAIVSATDWKIGINNCDSNLFRLETVHQITRRAIVIIAMNKNHQADRSVIHQMLRSAILLPRKARLYIIRAMEQHGLLVGSLDEDYENSTERAEASGNNH